jgi:hypothetical protein
MHEDKDKDDESLGRQRQRQRQHKDKDTLEDKALTAMKTKTKTAIEKTKHFHVLFICKISHCYLQKTKVIEDKDTLKTVTDIS